MNELSLTLFGTVDGDQHFTYPKDTQKIPEQYHITPQDFSFRPGGKLVQVIKAEGAGFYLSLHQQIYGIGSERPGYTFGPGVFLDDKNIKYENLLSSLFELHLNFSKECINESGKFNGQYFAKNYSETIDKKYEILKEDVLAAQHIFSDYSLFRSQSRAEPACINIQSINNLAELKTLVDWYLNSPASVVYKRLFIYQGDSGEPVGSVKFIDSPQTEDIRFFSLYADYVSKFNAQHGRAASEISSLKSQVEKLTSENSGLLRARQQATAQPNLAALPSGNLAGTASSRQLNNFQGTIDAVQARVHSAHEDLQKIKPQVASLNSLLNETNEKLSVNFIFLLFLMIFSLVLVAGGLFAYWRLHEVIDFQTKTSEGISAGQVRLINDIASLKSIPQSEPSITSCPPKVESTPKGLKEINRSHNQSDRSKTLNQ